MNRRGIIFNSRPISWRVTIWYKIIRQKCRLFCKFTPNSIFANMGQTNGDMTVILGYYRRGWVLQPLTISRKFLSRTTLHQLSTSEQVIQWIAAPALSLQWRHNGLDSVSNHHCLLNRLFGCRLKKASKLRVTGLCVGNSPGTGEYPAHNGQ